MYTASRQQSVITHCPHMSPLMSHARLYQPMDSRQVERDTSEVDILINVIPICNPWHPVVSLVVVLWSYWFFPDLAHWKPLHHPPHTVSPEVACDSLTAHLSCHYHWDSEQDQGMKKRRKHTFLMAFGIDFSCQCQNITHCSLDH